jgi:S-formylglutathione hydrolase FrmB
MGKGKIPMDQKNVGIVENYGGPSGFNLRGTQEWEALIPYQMK